MHFQTREENGVLRCEGHLDIRSVEELRHLLSECFGRNPQWMLDLSAVEGCDTAGVQLLHSAWKQASQCGRKLELHALSAAIQNTALMLGIPLEALGAGVSSV
jgi:anti-anti-sigma factor